ncbi:MAG: L-malate glycosyltransferase [Solirubrobacteraceae bacterium]|nr:L-malate glycosyltransferase [Solirubrobacteraceae bacterium]
MSVLFVNHTSRVSGAEHTLLDLLRGLPNGAAAAVACPPGDLGDRVAALGVPSVRLRGTDAGLALHPVRTPQALAGLAVDGVRVLRAARRRGSGVVHANSTRAALSCAVARRLGGPPLVVHVHDVLGDDRVSRLVRAVILATADVVLANSEHVRASVERPDGPPVLVVDNPVDLERFDPAAADGPRIRRELGLAPADPLLVLVGQITPWKGQETAIRALAELPPRLAATRLAVVGETVFTTAGTRFRNESYREELERLASDLGVGERVLFLGARDDVPDVLAAADVALVPSWEEPFGRVVIEAMAMGVAVVATEVGGPREILSAGGGVLVAPRAPEAWAAAITRLLDDPAARRDAGETGRAQARQRYGLQRFVERVLDGHGRARQAATRARPTRLRAAWARPRA